MTFCKSCLRNVSPHLVVVWLTLSIYGFLYPPLNWPDEYRNVGLIDDGNYGLVYGDYVQFVVRVVTAFTGQERVSDARSDVQESARFQRVNGELRYQESTSVSVGYYAAKFANFIAVSAFVILMSFLLCKYKKSDLARQRADLHVFMLSGAYPAVAYGAMQISTDLLFVLFSLVPFFLRSRRASLVFGLGMLPLMVEDRGFLILAAFIFVNECYKLLVQRAALKWKGTSRLLFLVTVSLLAIAVGEVVGSYLLQGLLLRGEVGVTVSDALQYTQTKTFDHLTSLVVLYAGIVILPSASEFFMVMLPLYGAFIVVFKSFAECSFSVRCGNAGVEAYVALVSVATVFFFITTVTHVFESGRYYLVLVPYIVNAFITNSSDGPPVLNRSRLQWTPVAFVGVAVFSVVVAQVGNI